MMPQAHCIFDALPKLHRIQCRPRRFRRQHRDVMIPNAVILTSCLELLERRNHSRNRALEGLLESSDVVEVPLAMSLAEGESMLKRSLEEIHQQSPVLHRIMQRRTLLRHTQ